MKFHDKGFINKFPNHTQVQIYSAGNVVLDLDMYEHQVCKETFKCQNIEQFNRENLDASYHTNIIKQLFDSEEKEVIFKDAPNRIFIKITKD